MVVNSYLHNVISSDVAQKLLFNMFLKGYSDHWEIHSIYLHVPNILIVYNSCAQRSLINN